MRDAAFDPKDPDHIVLGAVSGTFATFDGGLRWSSRAGSAVATWEHDRFDDISALAFSPADPSVMYFGLKELDVF